MPPLFNKKIATHARALLLDRLIDLEMDFATFFTHNPSDYDRLVKAIETTLTAYEPRLKDIKIVILPPQEGHIHNELQVGLDARLDATLLMDKVEEPISFLIRGEQAGEINIVRE